MKPKSRYRIKLPLTQSDVARVMTERGYPMTRGRVSVLEATALRKLKRALLELEKRAVYHPERNHHGS